MCHICIFSTSIHLYVMQSNKFITRNFATPTTLWFLITLSSSLAFLKPTDSHQLESRTAIARQHALVDSRNLSLFPFVSSHNFILWSCCKCNVIMDIYTIHVLRPPVISLSQKRRHVTGILPQSSHLDWNIFAIAQCRHLRLQQQKLLRFTRNRMTLSWRDVCKTEMVPRFFVVALRTWKHLHLPMLRNHSRICYIAGTKSLEYWVASICIILKFAFCRPLPHYTADFPKSDVFKLQEVCQLETKSRCGLVEKRLYRPPWQK